MKGGETLSRSPTLDMVAYSGDGGPRGVEAPGRAGGKRTQKTVRLAYVMLYGFSGTGRGGNSLMRHPTVA